MYVVPLALFVRRARELDYSQSKFDVSTKTIGRVFRVFTPEIVSVLNRHLAEYETIDLVAQSESLGGFAPPPGPKTLSSVDADMKSLFEEIGIQYFKKRELDWFDRFLQRFDALAGQVNSAAGEKKLSNLMERAKLIAGLPAEYDLLPHNSPSKSNLTAGSEFAERDDKGILTARGHEQVTRGESKFSNVLLPCVGDTMRRDVNAREIAILVELTIWASDRLNDLLGLDKDGKTFRINLRFLADYRKLNGLLIACFVVWIVHKIF